MLALLWWYGVAAGIPGRESRFDLLQLFGRDIIVARVFTRCVEGFVIRFFRALLGYFLLGQFSHLNDGMTIWSRKFVDHAKRVSLSMAGPATRTASGTTRTATPPATTATPVPATEPQSAPSAERCGGRRVVQSGELAVESIYLSLAAPPPVRRTARRVRMRGSEVRPGYRCCATAHLVRCRMGG